MYYFFDVDIFEFFNEPQKKLLEPPVVGINHKKTSWLRPIQPFFFLPLKSVNLINSKLVKSFKVIICFLQTNWQPSFWYKHDAWVMHHPPPPSEKKPHNIKVSLNINVIFRTPAHQISNKCIVWGWNIRKLSSQNIDIIFWKNEVKNKYATWLIKTQFKILKSTTNIFALKV